MNCRLSILLGGLVLAVAPLAHAESGGMTLPKQVEAGSAFSIPTTGSGQATLFLIGFGQVVRQPVQLGASASFAAGVMHNAGQYVAMLVTPGGTEQGVLEVTPASQVAEVSFLAKPSRISVSLHNGISGAVYLFDSYQNLVTKPTPVSFQLSGTSAAPQARSVVTRDGSAWTQMDSAAKEGAAQFVARVGNISSKRVIQQVPGDPCGLHMNAHPAPGKIELQTDPLRDCSGNAVPDGTIVTFTETYEGRQTTVDVPLKHGMAQAELPANDGAKISAATGVVMGNEIRWGRQ